MFATGNTTTTTGNMSQQTGGSLNVGAQQQQDGHLMNNNRHSNASLGMISSTTSYFDLDTNVEKTIATKTMAPYVLQGKELIEAGIDDTNCLINVPFSIPYMEVFIDKCQDLPTKLNSSGLCDPYIVLSVIQLGDSELRDFSQIPSNEEICKSSKIKKNNNPTWNGKERFLMSVPPQVFSTTSSSLGAMTMSGVSIQNSSSQSFTIGSKKTGASFKDKKSKSNDNIIPTVSKSSENIGFKNQYLLIQVYSYDRLKKDSFIGSARIGPLSRLPYGVMLSKTVPLHESGSGATCTVRFIAHNFGLSWEEFEEMDSSENDFLTFKPVCADPVKAVLDKITGSRYAGQFPNPKDEVRFATMLANKKHLMETYLNKDWVEVIPTQKRSIPKQEDLPEKDKKTPTSFSPSNEILPSNSVTTSPSPTHSSVVAVDSPRLFNVNPTPPQQQENQLNTTESPIIKESQSEDSINNQVEDTNTNNSSNSSEHEEEEQEADTEETVSDEEEEDEEEEEAEHDSKEMQEFIQEQEKQLLKGKVDIKLIIVDQERDQKFKSSARKLLSPILSKIGSTKNLSSFGMFHSSLLIGNWILEWNDSALCVPRRTLSKAALFCADLEPITTLEDLNEVVDKIADVIVEWNTTKKYKPMGGNRCVYGNCQDFVEAVLSRLGIKWQIENPYIRYFFEQLKKKGSTDLKLFFKKEDADQENSFVQKFKLLSQSGSTSGQGTYSIKFATHEQLDQFVLRCLRIDPMMKTNYPEVWGILKGFDRAFWLRHLAWEEMKERKRRELVSIERNLFKISQLRRANRLTEEDKSKESKLFERASEIQKEVDRIEKEGKPVKPFMGKQLDERKELVEVDLCPFSNPLTTYSIRLYN